MAVYEVPFSGVPESFTVSLGGIAYVLLVRWNVVDQCWVLDISDTTPTLIIGGVPIVTGTDLLAQYAYLGFTGGLVAQTDHSPDTVPAYDNLGTNSHLYFVTAP